MKRTAAIVLAIGLLGASSGCAAINEQASTKIYAASDGVSFNIDTVSFRNILFITDEDGNQARMLGTLLNKSDAAVTANFTVGGQDVAVQVPANSQVTLEDADHKVLIDDLGVSPGSTPPINVATSTGGKQTPAIPVLDNTLPEYEQYVPRTSSESPTPEHTAGSAEEGGH